MPTYLFGNQQRKNVKPGLGIYVQDNRDDLVTIFLWYLLAFTYFGHYYLLHDIDIIMAILVVKFSSRGYKIRNIFG